MKLREEEFYEQYHQHGGTTIIPTEIFNELYDDATEEIEILTNDLEREKSQVKEYGTRLLKAIEYIENEMPCLWEVDDVWEDINGNYQHNYKEYDTKILLNILKGVDKK